jgi:biopolymer transport protein ExbB/TolQ
MQDIVNLMWWDNPVLSRLFVSLLVLASILTTALALYHIWRYRVFETAALERLKGSLRRWQTEQQGSSQELVKLDALKQATPSVSLTHRRLLTIERMRVSNVKVNFEALQQITLAAESSRLGLRTPAFAVSFFLLLGLFGTVTSLCLALSGLSHTDAGLNLLFGGMAASFSSGMVGLISSLWISVVNLALTNAQSRFFESFESFTVEELLPRTVPDIRSEAWLRQMQYKIGESFERIKEIAEQNNQTFKEFETVSEGFARLVDSFEQSARKGASADVQTVLGQMGQVIGQVSRANDATLMLANSIPQALEAARSQNNNVLARVDALSQRANEQHQKVTQLLAATNDKLPQTVRALEQSNQAVMKRVEEMLVESAGGPVAASNSPFPPQALRVLLYSVPILFLLILVILISR